MTRDWDQALALVSGLGVELDLDWGWPVNNLAFEWRKSRNGSWRSMALIFVAMVLGKPLSQDIGEQHDRMNASCISGHESRPAKWSISTAPLPIPARRRSDPPVAFLPIAEDEGGLTSSCSEEETSSFTK